MKLEKFINESPIFSIELSNRMIGAGLREKLSEYGINTTQALILACIFFEKKTYPSNIAKLFHLPKAVISQHLSKLFELGYIIRKVDPDNAKKISLTLEPAEKKNILKIIGIIQKEESKIEKNIGKNETLKMSHLLHKVTQTICVTL